MTEEQLDNELHTIIGAVMLNNMVASSEACGRIKQARLINEFYDHFINNGDETKFNELKGLIK